MDELMSFITNLYETEKLNIDIFSVKEKILQSLPLRDINLEELFQFAAGILHTNQKHPDYDKIATRLELEYIYKITDSSFSKTMQLIEQQLSLSFLKDIATLQLDDDIQITKDLLFDYTALKVLQHGFLLKNEKGIIVERPQFMFMRCAVQIHGIDKENVLKTYETLANHLLIHSSPTLMNSGKFKPQLSSCFIINSPDMNTFFNFLQKCETIMHFSGGLGCAFHKIPCEQFICCIKLLENTVKLVTSNAEITRPPSCAVYIEPHHASIFDFLELRLNHGDEEKRARNLFYALWVSDLFMKRVENDDLWSLFDPKTAPNLEKVHGEKFEQLYTNYESQKLYVKQINARKLFTLIAKSQIETGMPYFIYKDIVNKYSPYPNQTIESSNLCSEIVEYCSKNETAVCILGNIALPKCIKEDKTIDYNLLSSLTKILVRNLDLIIDKSWYPTDCSYKSSKLRRHIAIGVQGLADVFQIMEIPYSSEMAMTLNKMIFRTIYLTALNTSNSLVKEGKECILNNFSNHHGVVNKKLLKKIEKYGLRNTLVTGVMPTSTSSLIFGNSESVYPYTSNFYTKKLISGDYFIMNKNLVKTLINLNLWNEETRKILVKDYGSVQNVKGFPNDKKEIYKTAFEISQKKIIQMASDRLPFVDQSESMSMYLMKPTISQVTSMLFYSWKTGLKTGLYYLHSKSISKAIQFSISPECCEI